MIKTSIVSAILVCACIFSANAGDKAKADERARQIFKGFDANGDGYVSLEEYQAGMVGNMASERVKGVFQEKDRDGDGKLNLEEFLYVPMDQRPPAPAKKER